MQLLQNILVGVIILAAAIGVMWFLVRAGRGKSSCACGQCPSADSCRANAGDRSDQSADESC